MSATGTMPPKKKSDGPTPPPVNPVAEKTEFSESVKLRKAFKKRLQTVAVNLGVPMGEIIERQTTQFVDGEYQRILKQDG